MNCGFSVKGSSPDELMPKIAEHAKTAHKIDEINEDLKKKVQGAIKKTMF